MTSTMVSTAPATSAMSAFLRPEGHGPGRDLGAAVEEAQQGALDGPHVLPAPRQFPPGPVSRQPAVLVPALHAVAALARLSPPAPLGLRQPPVQPASSIAAASVLPRQA